MLRRLVFAGLVIYAWGLSMFVDTVLFLDQTSRTSPLYLATIAPALLFVLSNLNTFISARYTPATIALACFMALVTVVSVARADFSTALSIGLLSAMLIAFQHSRASVGLGLVNSLFVLSIVSCAVVYALGAGKYGIFPGQSEDQGRISLFPYNVTPSWLMALIVIGMNYFHNRTPALKWLAIAVAAYFIVFSGSRSSLIILFFCGIFVASTRLVAFRHRPFYRYFIPVITLLFIVALNSESILIFLVSIDHPLVSSLLFRDGANTVDDATTSIYRTIIWAAHLDVFASNPLVGQGTFVFGDIAPDFGDGTTGSESFLTGLFARVGLLAALFVYFILSLASDASRRRDYLSYCLAILLVLSSLAYGSYIVPYDFVFILLFGALNHAKVKTSRPRVAAAKVPAAPTEEQAGKAVTVIEGDVRPAPN